MALVPSIAGCANCNGGGGGGGDQVDVESLILCDVGPDGQVLGTALAVYEYDDAGLPVGPPTFVIPGTNDPYVIQGSLQACPGEVGCGAPQQFCFASTDTVDAPGRQYDLTFTLGAGFAVTGIIRDLVNTPFNVLWDVNDSTAATFTTELQAALQSQFPGQTVTVVQNGAPACDGTSDFTIHVECLRIDQDPPTLLQLQYNGGRDAIQNAPFAETPPLNPIVQQGNYGYHILGRADDPAIGPWVGVNSINCTSVANRGWETNDINKSFEIWGQDVSGGVTPTPRGTPIQEIASDGAVSGLPTLWQTFQVTAAGNFTIRVIHGARDPGEQHRIFLSTGDTGATGTGDIINDITNPPAVYGGNAWTVFNQVVPLAPGTYTLAISTTQPAGSARGGLFTDMRAFVDAPGVVSSFVNDDDTCTVPVTSTDTTCEFWAPRCVNGTITSWYKIDDGTELLNADFWAQVPAPQCCTSDGGGGGDAVLGNLIHTYLVCGQTETGPRTLSRVVITDQTGAAISEQFVDTNGALVTPSSWQPGACAAAINVDRTLGPVCWVPNPNTIPLPAAGGFLSLDQNDNVVLYDGLGQVVQPGTYTIVICPQTTQQSHVLCDDNGPFLRWYIDSPIVGESDQQWDFTLDGSTPYVPVGPVVVCGPEGGLEIHEEILCDLPSGVPFLRTYIYDAALGVVVSTNDATLNGNVPYVIVGTAGVCVSSSTRDSEAVVLCDANGTQFLRKYVYDGEDATFVGILNTTLDGNTLFAPVGVVSACPINIAQEDDELLILCSSTPVAGTQFLRRYRLDAESGAVIGIVNTTLDGTTPFVPGVVSVCAQTVVTDTDFVQEQLCDTNGGFIRRFTFNSVTGAVIAVSNLTLAGAAYVPVGTVGTCEACCPIEIGRGCTNVGSLRYTALRLSNGTISLIDSVTGAAVLPANVVACADDDTVLTLNSQHFDALPGTPWTTALVVGTGTSLTYTVVSGTATVTDQNGTVIAAIPAGYSATWTAEDNNTLLMPNSIAADAASRVIVHWTQR